MRLACRGLALALTVLALGSCRTDPPKVAKFTAEPDTIDEGSATFLKWETSGATSIGITAGGQEVASSNDASGTAEVKPTLSTTYTLTARNEGGFESKSVSVTVRKLAKILSFTAAPDRLRSGDTVTVAWITEGAESVTLLDPDLNPISIDPAQTSSSTSFKIVRTGSYKLVATSGALQATQELKLTVAAPPAISSFTATPALIDPGTKVTLAWVSTGADSVKIKDDTDRTLPMGIKLGTDSYSVSPTVTTTYTLTATSFGGDSTAQVTVKVKPQLKSFTSNVPAQSAGGKVQLSWSALAVNEIVISDGTRQVVKATGADALTGTFEDTIPASATAKITYTLEGKGDGSATKTLDVLIGDAPVITKFVADPPAVLVNSAPTLIWETSGGASLSLKIGGTNLTTLSSQSRLTSGNYTPTKLQSGDTTYDLVLKSAIGVVTTASVTVKVARAPSILNFSGAPNPLTNGGDQLTLSWTASDAVEARLDDAAGIRLFSTADPAVAQSGSFKLRPAASETFKLTVVGVTGATVSRTARVIVTNPLSFKGTPQAIVAGERSTLAWDVSATTATAVQIAPRPFTRGAAPFEDITATGTVLTFTNDDDALAPLTFPTGFTFPFNGSARSVATVSTNGWIGLSPSGYAFNGAANESLPSATVPDVVAPFWDDLKHGTGKVLWALRGAAPDRHLVVSYEGVGIKVGTGAGTADGALDFQVALFESGAIEVRYRNLTATSAGRALGSGATIGISPGTDASPFSVDQASLTANSSLTWATSLPQSGTAEVAPLSNQSYTLSASASGVLVRAQTVVQVLQPGDIEVSEVMFEPPAALGVAGQWVELRSRARYDVDLTGFSFSIDGVAATVPALVLSAGSRLLFGVSSDLALNGGVELGFAYGSAMAMTGARASILLSARGKQVAALSFDQTFPRVAGAALVRDDAAKTTRPLESYCSATTAYGTSGARGTPNLPNDGCHFKVEEKVDFVDVSGSINPAILSGAATTGTLAMPFPFTWFGIACTNLTISKHGFAACGATSSSHPSNGTFPSATLPNGMLAPFWDEQATVSGKSKLVYDVLGTTPDRVLVIEWQHFDLLSTAVDADLTYELKIHENGDVEFQYGAMSPGDAGDRATGSSATVGLEDGSGTLALPIATNQVDGVKGKSGLYFRKR